VALERGFQRLTVLLSVVVLALETLGWAQTAGTREQSVPSKETAGAPEVLIAYATSSKLAAGDYAVAAGRLAPYLENPNEGINESAKTLVAVYRSLQQIETQAYDARILILRGNANSSDMRVRAAELRSARQVGLANSLLTMKMVRFAVYDMRPGGNPNATLRVAITEDQRQRLLQSINRSLSA
jgi:Tfp pilus assembly protein PilX